MSSRPCRAPIEEGTDRRANFYPCPVLGALNWIGRMQRCARLGHHRQLHEAGDGFTGTIKTLSLNAQAEIKPAYKPREKAPTYRI